MKNVWKIHLYFQSRFSPLGWDFFLKCASSRIKRFTWTIKLFFLQIGSNNQLYTTDIQAVFISKWFVFFFFPPSWLAWKKATSQNYSTAKLSCLHCAFCLPASYPLIDMCTYFPFTWMLHLFQMAELGAGHSSSLSCNAADKASLFPLAGLRHSWVSSEDLRNYPSNWQYITLPADYNINTVNYFRSFTKLKVRDDCFFRNSLWNTFSIKPWNHYLQ